jgi:hypothetical protein
LSKYQKAVLSENAADKVLACLVELEEEWGREAAEVVKD